MRNIFTFIFILFSFFASAQFTIQPQIGLENSRTTVNYNGQSFAPVNMQISPQAGLVMTYTFKQGHGIFAGISTNRSAIDFKFSDPQTAGTVFNAARENIKLQLEGGYQFSTKPIYFSRSSTSNTSFKSSGSKHFCTGINCYHHSPMNRCSHSANKNTAKNNGSYMRIMPSAGLAFIPSQPKEIITETNGIQTSYDYKAGSWNTALIAGTAFEFGSKGHANFVVNIKYLKGLGNLDTKTINDVSNGKSTTTTFSSKTSGFSLGIGIPISFNKSFNKRQAYINKEIERLQLEKQAHSRCGQFKPQHHGGCGQYRKYQQ